MNRWCSISERLSEAGLPTESCQQLKADHQDTLFTNSKKHRLSRHHAILQCVVGIWHHAVCVQDVEHKSQPVAPRQSQRT